MRFRSTLVLFVAACALAGVILVVEWHRSSAGRPPQAGPLLHDFDPDKVKYLCVQRAGARIDCMRQDGQWRIVRPVTAAADERMIDMFLGGLASMKRGETITASQMENRNLRVDDYGLASPRAKVTVGDGSRQFEIWVGGDSPLGKGMYVRLPPNDDVVSTERSMVKLLPAGVETWRDRVLLPGDTARVRRLEVHRKGRSFIQLARHGTGWSIIQPLQAHGAAAPIQALLDKIFEARISRFVADADTSGPKSVPADTAVAKAPSAGEMYGLAPDEAVLRVNVWVEGEEVGKEIVFGKTTGESGAEVFVRTSWSDSVYAVPKALLDTLAIGVDDVRDPILFHMTQDTVNRVWFRSGDRRLGLEKAAETGWNLVEPIRHKADDRVVASLVGRFLRMQAEQFVAESPTNLAAYGLASPYMVVSIGEKGAVPGPGAGGTASAVATNVLPLQSLAFGMPPSTNAQVFAKFESAPSVYRLAFESLKTFGEKPLDPLTFRDRSILAVPAGNVQRVTISRNGVEESIERLPSGQWTVLSPASNVVDVSVVDELLFTLANLRALRIETTSPGDLAPYGLDRPGIVVTIGMTGKEGIQKSVGVGFKARTDGVYAMLQGHDVVFVLDHASAGRLAASVTRPAGRGGSP